MFRRKGASFDLKSIREYQYFDDPRAIDWKLYGRTGRAYVKEFFDEASERVSLLVDSSGSVGIVSQDEYRAFISSLSYLLTAVGMGAALWFFGVGGLGPRLSLRSPGDLPRVFERLGGWKPAGKASPGTAYQALRAAGAARRAVIVSDFHEPGLRLPQPPGSLLFLARFRVPLESVAPVGRELEVLDPETGELSVEAWDEAERGAWWREEEKRQALLSAMGPRASYYCLDPGKAREGVYWDIMERLYA